MSLEPLLTEPHRLPLPPAVAAAAAASTSAKIIPSATLDVVDTAGDNSLPVLLQFPTKGPPDLKLSLTRNKSEKRKGQHEIKAENATMLFSGQNYGSEAAAGKLGGTLLIGVHKVGTDKVRLVQPGALFQMHPTVKAPKCELKHVQQEEIKTGREGVAQAVAQKRKLVAELGSAKALKKQNKMLLSTVRADAIFNSVSLGSDLADAHAASSADGVLAQSVRDLHMNHPPFDLEATTVAGAYPIREGMIPPHVWSALDFNLLSEAQKSGQKGEEARSSLRAQPNLWPPFILTILSQPRIEDKASRHLLQRTLLYLAYILRFNSLRAPIRPTRPNQQRKTNGPCDHHPDAQQLQIPLAPWEQFIKEFTEVLPPKEGQGPVAGLVEADAEGGGKQPSRRITPELRDKIFLYAHTLALALSDGRVLASSLAPTLGLTEEKCAFYLKQLGCKVEKLKNLQGVTERMAVLHLPLSFPKLSRGKKKN